MQQVSNSLGGQDDVLSIVFQIDHQDLASVIKNQQTRTNERHSSTQLIAGPR